jgi:hypothetical protein
MEVQMSKSLPPPERLPAAQGFGRRGFAQAGKCQGNVKITQFQNVSPLLISGKIVPSVWTLDFI